MVFKRHLNQGDEEGSGLPNKRQHFASSFLKGLNYGRTVQQSVSCLEPLIRKMVQESVEQAFDRFLMPPYNQVKCPEPRNLQLQFHSRVPETMFTCNPLLSEDKTPIKVVLYDTASRQIMSWSPLSSIKLKIVVLDGDFVPDDREDWLTQEFDSKQVKNREGKRPLVAGDATVTLKDGVGHINDLNFTDNSKWSRTGKFRLGAKALLTSDDISIREAVSNAFRVKDHRGESYQKHYPPAMNDEVWRLEKIAKDGTSHKKLNDCGVFTVGDFLRLYATDQARLRAILGVSSKTWDTIITHAHKCDVGDDRSMYTTARGVLFFDSVHRVVGVIVNGENYLTANSLNSFQMRLVEDLKQQAYNNISEWIPVSDPPVAGFPMLLENAEAESFTNPNLDLIGINFQQQDEQGIEMSAGRSALPPPYQHEVDQENSCYELGESSRCPHPQGFNPTFRNSFAISDPLTGFCSSWGLDGNYAGSHLSTDDLPVAVDDTFPVESSAWQGNGLFLDPGHHGMGVISSGSGLLVPRSGSPKTRWCKVLAAVKWRILVRRNVAARKCKRLYSYI